MQDELKLYANTDNEFETEADEYPDEVEIGFDDDEDEIEEVGVIVTSTPVVAEISDTPLSELPAKSPAKKPAKKAAAKKSPAKKAVGSKAPAKKAATKSVAKK